MMSTISIPQTLADKSIAKKAQKPSRVEQTQSVSHWKKWQRILFRIAFVFFVFMSLPTNPEWYSNLISMDWTNLHYRDVYDLARFSSGCNFVGNTIFGTTLNGYANWLITLVVATVVGLAWSALDGKRPEYNTLYYWLRVIVRYRAGIGIIGFGFTKLFPVQMPYPSEGLLNTDFGDFTAQKIYWLSIGIVPWYQVFAGVVEVTAGVLLFFRKTTFLGAALLFGALGDILYVNFAYDGGVHVYSSYFVLLAAFLMIQDTPKLYNLFIRERYTVLKNFYPSFSQSWLKAARVGLKSATFILFIGVLFYLQYVNFKWDPYKQPSIKGVAALRGFYDVTEFRLNNKVIPYSPFDSARWKEATFEKWSTLTFKVNKPVLLDLSNGGGSPMRDINRTFELTGVAGGHRVFYYEADTVNNVLYLQDKNTASNRPRRGRNSNNANIEGRTTAGMVAESKASKKSWIPESSRAIIGNEDLKIDERARSTRRTKGIASEAKEKVKRSKMVLSYSTLDGSRVILKGINENRDSIYVVLDRVDKKYTLSKSNLNAGSY
jgi:hypothetical protein